MPNVILLMTGTELCRGETRDRNGPFLGGELTDMGLRVERIELLPDDPSILVPKLGLAAEEADVVITSGGLGPTADDHMVAAAAEAFGREVVRDEAASEQMVARIQKRYGAGHVLPGNFLKQAEVVAGSTVFSNPVGLAPGCAIDTPRGFVALLPGVPRELGALFHEAIAPHIRERFQLVAPRIFRAKLIGERESWAEERIQKLGLDFDKIEYGIAAKPGDLTVKLIVSEPQYFALIDGARELLAEEFGDSFVPLPEGLLRGVHGAGRQAILATHASLVHAALIEAKVTLVTAESCTGGMIAEELTHFPGSSAYLLGGVIAYDDRIKERVLGVGAELLAEHGAVSEPVCAKMLAGALALYGATTAVATTGIAGPGGGTAAKPVGLVFVGLGVARANGSTPEITVVRHQFRGGRDAVRQQATMHALDLVRRELLPR